MHVLGAVYLEGDGTEETVTVTLHGFNFEGWIVGCSKEVDEVGKGWIWLLIVVAVDDDEAVVVIVFGDCGRIVRASWNRTVVTWC